MTWMLISAGTSTTHSQRNQSAWVGPAVVLIGLFTYFTVAVRFPALRDSAIVDLALVIGGAAIAAWGQVHENGKPGGGAIARPAFFLVEPDGTISWRQLTDDYRVRVRPEDVLEALQSAG
jgi:hypothetical protein